MGVYGASVQNQPGAGGAQGDDDQDAFDGGTGGSTEEASAAQNGDPNAA